MRPDACRWWTYCKREFPALCRWFNQRVPCGWTGGFPLVESIYKGLSAIGCTAENAVKPCTDRSFRWNKTYALYGYTLFIIVIVAPIAAAFSCLLPATTRTCTTTWTLPRRWRSVIVITVAEVTVRPVEGVVITTVLLALAAVLVLNVLRCPQVVNHPIGLLLGCLEMLAVVDEKLRDEDLDAPVADAVAEVSVQEEDIHLSYSQYNTLDVRRARFYLSRNQPELDLVVGVHLLAEVEVVLVA